MDKLEGKVAIITGGSSGIGFGIAKRLAANGCKPIIIGRNMKALSDAAKTIDGLAIRADVTDLEAMQDAAKRTLDNFGRIDILVNNAGIGPMANLADMTISDWKWMLDSNLWSIINGLEVFLPILKANKDGGHIVNTSSISGMFAAPGIGGYAATKYAVVALSETLALELAEEGSKVGVSVFLPGPVKSNIHESTRSRPAWADKGQLRSMRLEEVESFKDIIIPWMEAEDAGNIVVEAIRNNRFYVWTHPDGTEPITDRFAQIAQSIQSSKEVVGNSA